MRGKTYSCYDLPVCSPLSLQKPSSVVDVYAAARNTSHTMRCASSSGGGTSNNTTQQTTPSLIELTSMLDSLGSTLSAETVNSFTRNGKKLVEVELTVDEAIRCLEMQVGRPAPE